MLEPPNCQNGRSFIVRRFRKRFVSHRIQVLSPLNHVDVDFACYRPRCWSDGRGFADYEEPLRESETG